MWVLSTMVRLPVDMTMRCSTDHYVHKPSFLNNFFMRTLSNPAVTNAQPVFVLPDECRKLKISR
jgi:hypothetical protein